MAEQGLHEDVSAKLLAWYDAHAREQGIALAVRYSDTIGYFFLFLAFVQLEKGSLWGALAFWLAFRDLAAADHRCRCPRLLH